MLLFWITQPKVQSLRRLKLIFVTQKVLTIQLSQDMTRQKQITIMLISLPLKPISW